MDLGNSLFQSRKKSGLSQEMVAEKLGISRQTVSKWETNDTVPDIYQAKKLAKLYNVSLDDLMEFHAALKEIEQAIKNINEEKEKKIDWTNVWSKKYPILAKYQQQINIEEYASKIREMLMKMKKEYDLNSLDSLLVLKDILYHVWKDQK